MTPLNIIRNNLFATSTLLFVVVGICCLPDAALGKDAFKEQIASPASYTGSSTAEIKYTDSGLHLITKNTQFTMYEFVPPKTDRFRWVVLRRTIVQDHVDGMEGADSKILVELLDANKVRWSFQEEGTAGGFDGKVVSYYVYQVTKYGCCDSPPTFTYYSLIDGRKLQSGTNSLSYEELSKLDESLAK